MADTLQHIKEVKPVLEEVDSTFRLDLLWLKKMRIWERKGTYEMDFLLESFQRDINNT